MFGLIHTVFLFWSVVFPFNYRKFRMSGRIRHAHIISVVLAVVIPIPAPLIHLKDGYEFTSSFPAVHCIPRNVGLTFYTMVIPISILLCITTYLRVLIIWTIFKVNKQLQPLCVRACMRACVRACVRACMRACMRACVHVCVCVCVHVYMCVC